jgi:kexin
MRLALTLVAAAAVASTAVAAKPARRTYQSHAYYVMEHDTHSDASIQECARALGVEVVERAGELRDHWVVRTPHSTKRDGVDPVLAAYQSVRQRAADSRWLSRRSVEEAKRIAGAVKYLERQEPRQRVKRASPDIPVTPHDPASYPKIHDVALSMQIRDPEFTKQWHLANDEYPQNSMNVTGVWEMGITGKGIISALVDDGLDYSSDDLAANFVGLGLSTG